MFYIFIWKTYDILTIDIDLKNKLYINQKKIQSFIAFYIKKDYYSIISMCFMNLINIYKYLYRTHIYILLSHHNV